MKNEKVNKKRVGDFIRKLREEKGWSKYRLALMLCVNWNTVYNWEIGKCLPDLYTLNEVCRVLGVDKKILVDFLNKEEIYIQG